MSKIEKALQRAQGERGNLQLVPVAGSAERSSKGTALLAERVANPETIARMAASESRLLKPDELSRLGIIHKGIIEEASVQAFRELRTRILQASRGLNGVILVTGVRGESGGTFVARNLAAAFAFDAFRTALLVDCNFKDPQLHALVGKASPRGLAEYLQNPHLDASEIIHPVGIARYRVIPSGTRNAGEVEHFASARMRELIDSLRLRYAERFIVLDGPPVSEIADTRMLAELADHVLLVARYGRATGGQIESSLNVIAKDKLLGVVFNDEPRIPWRR